MSKRVKFTALICLCIFVLGIALTGCSSAPSNKPADKPADKPAEKKEIVLKLGHEMPEDHPYQFGALKFAELVDKKTNGEVKVQVFPNGTLGKQAQLADGVSMGTIDMAEAVTIILEKYNSQYGVWTVPYLFRDWDHVWKVADGPVGEKLSKLVEPKGIKVLAYFQNGITSINSRMPIKTPADMKGIKLRVQQGPSFVEAGNILKSVVTPLAYGEIYAAMQMGTIDAQIQQINNMRSNKHYEVAKYYCDNQMYYLLEPLMISTMVYNKLSPEHQKALVEAAKEAAVEQRKFAEQKVKEDEEFMVKNGGLQIYKPNIDEWKKAVEPAYEKFADWKELIEEIQNVK